MRVCQFETFGRWESGRCVTSAPLDGERGLLVLNARNPYGRHNLVLAEMDARSGYARAYRHGNAAVLADLARVSERAYRRARRFLAERGTGRDWYRDTNREDCS